MSNPDVKTAERYEKRKYVVGFTLCVIATVIAFGTVAAGLPRATALWIIGIAAISQLIFQLHYFLHINHNRQSREDLLLVLFTAILISLMIFGTIWVLGDLSERMIMPAGH